MKCKQWKYQIADYASGSLDETQARLVEAHLRVCPACHEEAERFVLLFASMKKEPHDALVQTDWDNFLVHEREKNVQKRMDPFMGTMVMHFALPAALCVLLFIGGIFAWHQLRDAASDLAMREAVRNVVSQLSPAQIAAIELPSTVDPSLRDILSPTTMEVEFSDSLTDHVTDQLFADISESDLYTASSEYILPSEASPFYDSDNALGAIQDISSKTGK